MIFRGRSPEAAVWRRFGNGKDTFSFKKNSDGLYEARVSANAERAVDLLYALAEHLAPAINVHVHDKRHNKRWSGKDVPLPDVRDAIARLRVGLATSGGIEISLYTEQDQLTLTAGLELCAYAVSDRWLFLLQGIGLERDDDPLKRRNQPWDKGSAQSLSQMFEVTAERLSLTQQ